MEVEKLGEVVGVGHVDLYREDLKGYYGFNIECGDRIDAADLIWGRVAVYAVSAAGRAEIKLPVEAERRLKAQLAKQLLAELGEAQRLDVIQTALNLGGGAEHPTADPAQDRPVKAISPVMLPLGQVSGDGTARLAANGFLFLNPKTRAKDRSLSSISDQWVRLIRQRQEWCSRQCLTFLQIIIPEKQTLLECSPDHGDTLARIESQLREEVEYISGADVLSCEAQVVFRKVDSHLSPYGAYLLVEELCRRVGAVCPGCKFTEKVNLSGDLSKRFFGINLYESVEFPDEYVSVTLARDIKTLELVDTTPAKHVGCRAVWENPSAPNDKSIVIFGNSFFSLGEDATQMSWWCKRIFRQVHFLWSPSIQLEYLDGVRPDFVIAQTIERYLPQVPST